MINKVTKTLAVAVVAGAAIFSLSACSAPAPTHTIAPMPAPTSIDLATFGSGGKVKTTVGSAVILQVANGTEADWTGTTSDDKVAVFVQGIYTDNVVAIPSINPKAEGKATIKLHNVKTDADKTIEVEVSK